MSGGELVEQGALQATRLGATINAPCTVVGLNLAGDGYAVSLGDGTDIPCRAVVIASGVQYRRLPLDRLDEFDGAGVYYAATDLEARVCAGQPVTVVGGGNSAGQAAIYLAQGGCDVTIVIRGDDLAASMSSYLIDRIDAAPNITLLSRTQVVELHGERSLTGDHDRDRMDAPPGTRRTRPDGSCRARACSPSSGPHRSRTGSPRCRRTRRPRLRR